jgi:hypothetical protein
MEASDHEGEIQQARVFYIPRTFRYYTGASRSRRGMTILMLADSSTICVEGPHPVLVVPLIQAHTLVLLSVFTIVVNIARARRLRWSCET